MQIAAILEMLHSSIILSTGIKSVCTFNPDLEYFKARYIVQDVLYNGNCMFSCLAAGLNGQFTADMVHNIHQEIVTFLRGNRVMVNLFLS